MNLAATEMKRSKLRFGLLTGAVSLLVFLVLLLTTLSNALVSSLVGAFENLQSDGLVYSDTARDNIAASRLPAETVSAVAAIPGVTAAGPIGTFTTNATLGSEESDMQIFGYGIGSPGSPGSVNSGRLPQAAGEAAVDGGGVAIGDQITLNPSGETLTVVGTLRGAQFNAIPTAYVSIETYNQALIAANPGLPFVPINAVAFDTNGNTESVAAAIGEQAPGLTGYTIAQATELIPGIESISQSFGILVGLTFVIGIVVIGFFFLILTVQKLRSFVLLRAIGASKARLAGTVAFQITLVVLLASLVALLLTFGAVQGLNTGIPVRLEPATILTTVASVLVFSLLAGLLSIRRIAKIDPATAGGSR